MASRTPSWMIPEQLVSDDLQERFASLTTEEFDAVVSALVWYANYERHNVVENLGDTSMPAQAHRDKFRRLHSALGKMGTRIRSPFVDQPPTAR